MKKKTENKNKNLLSEKLNIFSNFVKKQYKIVLLIFIGYVALSAINFFNVATGQSIVSVSLRDFEIGQIADRTIIAPRSIPSDLDNPVSILAGEKIIRKGFAIEQENYDKLKKLSESPQYFDVRKFLNNELFFVIFAVVWILLLVYLPFGRKILLSELILQVTFFLAIYATVAFSQKLSVFSLSYFLPIIVPATFFVILITIMYGQLQAILFSALAAFGVYNATNWAFVPFLYTILSCIFSSNIVRKIERRIDMVVASIIIAFINVVCIAVLVVIDNENFFASKMPFVFFGVAFNGFISGILALGFLTPLELILNTASIFRLMDLSDLNNPTLRKMLLTAPGTYNHSIMVAQLAENACRVIGANALIARVGAYYHDIGKMDQSQYFIENQTDVNKPSDENPALQLSIIKTHVKRSVEKAHKMHLPQPVIDIIAEHHGNSLISYFYKMALEKDPKVNPEEFRYAGSPPATRESAVVMLADTVEAACRTLSNPTLRRLTNFIDELISKKTEMGQLDYCALTFSDVAKIREEFANLLEGYYHNRIEYPDQKDPDEVQDEKDAPVTTEKKSSSGKEKDNGK